MSVHFAAGPAKQASEGRRPDRGGDQQVRVRAHALIDAWHLKGADDAGPGDLASQELRDLHAVQTERGGIDRKGPDGVEQRGLARPVRPDQPDNGALLHAQAHLIIGDDTVKGLGHMSELEHRAHGEGPLADAAPSSDAMPGFAPKRSRTKPTMPAGKNTATATIR